MNLDYFDELDRARERIKPVTICGIDFQIKADDTYGFQTIKQVKGETPKELTGQYTSLEFAKKAIEAYFRSIKNKPQEVTLLSGKKPRREKIVVEQDSE